MILLTVKLYHIIKHHVSSKDFNKSFDNFMNEPNKTPALFRLENVSD